MKSFFSTSFIIFVEVYESILTESELRNPRVSSSDYVVPSFTTAYKSNVRIICNVTTNRIKSNLGMCLESRYHSECLC